MALNVCEDYTKERGSSLDSSSDLLDTLQATGIFCLSLFCDFGNKNNAIIDGQLSFAMAEGDNLLWLMSLSCIEHW